MFSEKVEKQHEICKCIFYKPYSGLMKRLNKVFFSQDIAIVLSFTSGKIKIFSADDAVFADKCKDTKIGC